MAAAGDEAAQTIPAVPPHSVGGRGGHGFQFGSAGQPLQSLRYAKLGLSSKRSFWGELRIVLAERRAGGKKPIAYTDMSLSRYILLPQIFTASGNV